MAQPGGPAIAARIPMNRVGAPMHFADGPNQQQFRPRGGGYQPYRLFPRPPIVGGGGAAGPVAHDPNAGNVEYDGRRLRKSLVRKTVDYNAAIIKGLQNRVWQRDHRDRRMLEPDYSYAPDTVPPAMMLDNPTNAVTTRYVKSATNKMRCPIFAMTWTPEGRRLITGASSGEFTLWNGLTFNFETILQAHDAPVRAMVWSHNDSWMVTGDHKGYVKYWQSNMNNVQMFQAHKEAVRGLTFSPSDQKFASCSDDGTIRVWDFYRCYEEKILRGHGADVKCVGWHPHKALIISGSKDNQQPVKLWDPKSGASIATIHAHKSTVMDCRWNRNGNWFVTASRDHLVKLYDIRKLSQEMQIFRGHKKEASCVSWHPIHETLFASGGSDGSILFWDVGCDKEVGSIEAAHDNIIWSLAWHPVGHILCSGSNDHTSKFWTRQRPGDVIRDRTQGGFNDSYAQDENEMEEIIPGMGPEDKVEVSEDDKKEEVMIPGLDFADPESIVKHEKYPPIKKQPYQKPIPKKFQAIWNDTRDDELEDDQDRVHGNLLPPPPGMPPPGMMNPNGGMMFPHPPRPDGPMGMGGPPPGFPNPFMNFPPPDGYNGPRPGFDGPPGPNPFWQPPPGGMPPGGHGPAPLMSIPTGQNMNQRGGGRPPMNRGPRQQDPRDRDRDRGRRH